MNILLYVLAGFGVLFLLIIALVIAVFAFCWIVARWKISRDRARGILSTPVDTPPTASPTA